VAHKDARRIVTSIDTSGLVAPALVAGFFMRGRMAGMARRFQFSLYNTLRATAWLSIGGASWWLLKNIDKYSLKWPDVAFVTLLVILFLTIVASPVIAIGSLFGRTKTGMFGGLALGATFIVLSLVVSWAFL